MTITDASIISLVIGSFLSLSTGTSKFLVWLRPEFAEYAGSSRKLSLFLCAGITMLIAGLIGIWF